ncbi:uncharacterized protein LOC135331087 [Halichondria panicea]|uniref:uncharacterized protein LOC135331087 n=1 Tax=Halichondria panicea TaxID=6063 RepID=UPI00312BB165
MAERCDNSRSLPKKKRARHGFRYQMELNFDTEDVKQAFVARIDRAKRSLAATARGSLPLDSRELISVLLDKLEQEQEQAGAVPEREDLQSDKSKVFPMLENSGIFTSNTDASDEQLFVCELKTLFTGLSQACDQCQSYCRRPTNLRQNGHVVRFEFKCGKCGKRQWWASSRTLGGRYLVNQKIVHAFTCAGVLPSQYLHFSSHAGLGKVSSWYISSMYKKGGYLDVVNACAKASMLRAIDEVKALPGYSQDGEWVITDARHDSTANAYNTTVPCLSGSTKRIVGCSTVSRKEHICAQTREVACTKIVLPEVIDKGLNIVEVAHDNQPVVKRFVTDDLNLTNSYDTWHGTKNVAKKMKKVAIGTKKAQGKTWFPELSDKRKSTKVHLYYCMKNCEQSADNLRKNILNIVKHYQNEHSDCNEASPCKRPGYKPTKIKLEDPLAIESFTSALKDTLIYKNAESYCRVSRHILGGVFQSPAAHIHLETCTLCGSYIQHENEPCYYGLERECT